MISRFSGEYILEFTGQRRKKPAGGFGKVNQNDTVILWLIEKGLFLSEKEVARVKTN